MRPRSGLFIALEGGEGTGKSTLTEVLAKRLRDSGRDVRTVREPGGTSFGEAVRDLLATDGLSPWAEALAFLAARAQLVETVIRPALAEGRIVISDRFSASTFAYQGHARGLDLTVLKVVNRIATGGLEPDLTVLLDLEPAEGLARKGHEESAVRTGTESLDFHLRVREGFLELAATATPGTWVKLDASAPAGKVAEAAWRVLEPRLRRAVPPADGSEGGGS